jgi:hypothetical protein
VHVVGHSLGKFLQRHVRPGANVTHESFSDIQTKRYQCTYVDDCHCF